jgi:hypothetical protein
MPERQEHHLFSEIPASTGVLQITGEGLDPLYRSDCFEQEKGGCYIKV